MKYYILSVDSYINAFSFVDAMGEIRYTFEKQGNNMELKALSAKDMVFVYKKLPIGCLNILLEVVDVKENVVVFKKIIELNKGIQLASNECIGNLENRELVEIDETTYQNIKNSLIENFIDNIEVIGEENLKEQFKNYILEVLQLKSTRQVVDLDKFSQKLVDAKVIEKGVYLISNVEEYRSLVKVIKDSDEYKRYKAERKEKNPNSGLALDQGLTNYEHFLVYVSKKQSNSGGPSKAKRITGAENILLYGVPGAGKSHTIKTQYCSDPKRMERVVFHPDYMYSDFVGQILPRVESNENGEDKLKYVFTPGPFTKMLKKAEDDPGNYYYLVIEELNRGNAPAIFGEIFQLLDRKDEEDFPADEVGESEYGISNYDVAKYVYGDEDHEVKIPSNMYVLATMNTADQNVFTLDTAFQRRWHMKQIENRFEKSEHSKDMIAGTYVNWGAFATVINDLVIDVNADMISSEDKRLGTYFAKKKELEVDRFPEKVLKYLWDDAFKMDKTVVFDEKYKSLEEVVMTYEMAQPDKLSAVLHLRVYEKMLSKMKEDTKKDDN